MGEIRGQHSDISGALIGARSQYNERNLGSSGGTATVLRIVPLPAYVCYRPGHGRVGLQAVASVPAVRRDGTVMTMAEGSLINLNAIARLEQEVECVDGAAIYFADNQHLARSGDELIEVGSVGALVNVVRPTSDVIAAMSATEGGAVIYEGVASFDSVAGTSPITLARSLQTATATHDGDRYVITGATGSAVFGQSDSLTVSGTPAGASEAVQISVNAPAPVTAISLFGALDGLRTEIHQPDGSFDAFAITITLEGSSESGDTGLLRVVPADSLPLEEGQRADGGRALEISPTTPEVCSGSGWMLAWSSTGDTSGNCSNLTGGDGDAAIVERVEDGVRYRIDLAFDSTTTSVDSVASYEGALPSAGEKHDCETLPRAFDVPATSQPNFDVYGSVCIDSDTQLCSVLGDVAATPESESCDAASPLFDFGYNYDNSQAFFRVHFVSGYEIAQTTHGTLLGTYEINDLPADGTDVTVQLDATTSGPSYVVVFDWDGEVFNLLSIDTLE